MQEVGGRVGVGLNLCVSTDGTVIWPILEMSVSRAFISRIHMDAPSVQSGAEAAA